VKGHVSLTWQVSNADAYFAVTGHWIEEGSQVQSLGSSGVRFSVSRNSTMYTTGKDWAALSSRSSNGSESHIRFLKILTGHGVSLFVQISFVTCDNASNNDYVFLCEVHDKEDG
jgi:hypothetical protein